MKVIYLSGVISLAIVLCVAAWGQDSLVLYDDFSHPLIDPAKWVGGEVFGTGRETIRMISGGQLHMSYRSYGSTTSDVGNQNGFLNIFFINPATITTIRAAARVNGLQAIGCSTPGSFATGVRAEIHGRFFNTGTPTPDSSLGDVFAHIYLLKLSNGNPLQVLADVGECSDAFCNQGNILGFLNLGNLSLATTVTLLMQWDRPNHRFIFQRDNQPLAFIPYAVSDTAPPSLQFKMLDVNNFVANCTATPRPVGFLDVSYDNVYLNSTAVQADLAVTVSAVSAVTSGSSLTYTIVGTNVGPDSASNVQIVDPIPAGTTFSSITVSPLPGTTCTAPAGGSNAVTCQISTLANGASLTIQLTVQVTACAWQRNLG
jgi:uncharacterized repeat protein (TIGR01451 family)